MAISIPTPALAALLCLGLCGGSRNQVQAGTPLKPSIWATPGSWIPYGSSVTIWCQGPPQAAGYHLHKKGSHKNGSQWSDAMEESPDSRGRASYSIERMTGHWAGQYQCGPGSAQPLAQLSDPLALVVTGLYPAPLLEAHPSSVVAEGGNVTLSCSTRYKNVTVTFYLVKEGDAEPRRGEPQGKWQRRTRFPLGPVNASHGGTYSCYGSSESLPYSWTLPSAPLHLQVTGVYEAPSLWAQPGSLVLSGDNLTLRCRSKKFDTFALTKDQQVPLPSLHGQPSPNFPLGPVNGSHGGRYRCYGGYSRSPLWSEPSAPLDILVAGAGRRPRLSAQPGPHMLEGEDVTLLCRSAVSSDTFYLAKDGSAAAPERCQQDLTAPSQANFTLRAVNATQGGTYRCYSSNSSAPHLLSLPSDPLELLVSGLPRPLPLVLGLSAACGLLMLLLGLLLLRHRCRRQAGHTKSGAAHPKPQDRDLHNGSGPSAQVQEDAPDAEATHTQPEERAQLDPQQSINSEDLQGATYAQVNHTRLRQRDVPEALEDVTYAELNHLVLREQTTATSSAELPEGHSVYAALASTSTGPTVGSGDST